MLAKVSKKNVVNIKSSHIKYHKFKRENVEWEQWFDDLNKPMKLPHMNSLVYYKNKPFRVIGYGPIVNKEVPIPEIIELMFGDFRYKEKEVKYRKVFLRSNTSYIENPEYCEVDLFIGI